MALLGSMLALIGVAPFAIFMSEYQVVRAAIAMHQWAVLGIFVVAGSVIFISALRHVIEVLYGKPSIEPVVAHDGAGAAGMVGMMLALLLLLGLWLPSPLFTLMQQAATVVTGT